MSYHYPLAPSFAPVWGHCSGAIAAALQFPNLETDATREGTAAHWVFSETVERVQAGVPTSCADMLGHEAPNGVIIDEKMCEGAQVMVDDLLAVCARHGATPSELLIEHGVTMPSVHPQNGGTLDAALHVLRNKVLYIWDYKHGHMQCPAKENLQLIDYAEGLATQLGLNGIDDQETTLVIRIVQPFCFNNSGPVDEWTVKLSEIRGHINRLHAKAHEAFANPLLSAGSHCRYCPAVGKCSAARQSCYNLVAMLDRPYAMDGMTAHDLALELDTLSNLSSMVKGRLSAIEDDLHHRLRSGETGSGLTLQTGYGRLKWDCPPQQAEALAKQFGFSVATEAVKTPTQAKQAAPKAVRAMFEQVLGTVTSKPVTGLKLIKAADTVAAKAFQTKN